MSTLTRGNAGKTSFTVLVTLSLLHLFNDTIQSLIQAIYPILRVNLELSYAEIGRITLVFQFASSIFQPLIGLYGDRRPQPNALLFGMGSTLCGLVMLAFATNYSTVLFAVVLIGTGASVFHPEASRMAYMASGGRFGFAQSLFQVGGTFGGSLGPLLVALYITETTQSNLAWFVLIPLVAMASMVPIRQWYKRQLQTIRERRQTETATVAEKHPALPTHTVVISLCVLLTLIISKYAYWAGMGSYYIFFLQKKFALETHQAQYCLALFSFSMAAGTLIGGPVGDRIGRKYVIWVSILGVAPLTILLPRVDSLWLTCMLSVLIGLILSSAFSAILIYAQELIPGKVGMIAGFFFGFAFGVAGISAELLGRLADIKGIEYVYQMCSFLPLLGIVTVFLPNLRNRREPASNTLG